jgi:hypothetical protein
LRAEVAHHLAERGILAADARHVAAPEGLEPDHVWSVGGHTVLPVFDGACGTARLHTVAADRVTAWLGSKRRRLPIMLRAWPGDYCSRALGFCLISIKHVDHL